MESNGEPLLPDMLRLHASDFGRWQLRHFVLNSSAWALEAMHTMVMIFEDQVCRAGPGRCSGADLCWAGPEWEWTGGIGSSTVAEWGLVCGERYKVGLVQASFFAGCMIGALRAGSSFSGAQPVINSKFAIEAKTLALQEGLKKAY